MNEGKTLIDLVVLIIDDNPDDRALVKRELQREFPSVSSIEITDESSLYGALSKGQFDLAVTDYELKWTDGLCVTRAIKGRYPDCPVVMFTNSGDEEVAVKALKQGVDDYVLKRKGYKPLAATVKNVLSLSDTRAGRIPRCLLWCANDERQLIREGIRDAHNLAYTVPCASVEEYRRSLDGAPTLYDAVIAAKGADFTELVHLVRETTMQIPMLPMLIIADDAVPVEYYEAGAWAVIPRPLNKTILTAWLRRAFHISALGRRVMRQNEALERYARSFESKSRQDIKK